MIFVATLLVAEWADAIARALGARGPRTAPAGTTVGGVVGLVFRDMRAWISEDRVQAERRRIAQDLHDGLAQDLAFIVAHSDRLAIDLGTEHPVAVAARRALDVARGAIVDLNASHLPSTLDALRAIATELEDRYAVEIDVLASGGMCPPTNGIDHGDRNDLVRIAREAMINAVRHGGARHVSVELGTRTHPGPLLRVRDDGVGIGMSMASTSGTGLGLPGMARRASALGGRLSTRRCAEGGTEIEIRI